MQLDDPLTAALRGLLDVIERWHQAVFEALFTLYAKGRARRKERQAL